MSQKAPQLDISLVDLCVESPFYVEVGEREERQGMEALQARSELEETLKRLQQHKARIAVVRIISSEIHII